MEEVKNEDKRPFWAKVITGGIFLISILILIGVKLGSDKSLIIWWILLGFSSLAFIIALFGKKLYNFKDNLNKKEKEPKPISEEEVKKILKKMVEGDEEDDYGMMNYIEFGTPIIRKAHNINNNQIQEFHTEIYRDIELGKEKSDKIIQLLNTTFPDLHDTLPEDCDKDELNNLINKLSRSPLNPSEIEETELGKDFLGNPTQKTKKISYNRQKEEKEESVV